MKQTTTLDFGVKPIFHVGVSSGKDSTALLLWMIHESGIPREQIRVTFSDTDNEDPLTYAHLEKIRREIIEPAGIPGGLEVLQPKLGFFQLVFKKGRFPSRVAQFCTEDLKIEPLRQWLRERWAEGYEVIVLNGKRVGESNERAITMANQPERSFSDFWGCEEWMPLRAWTLGDVLRIHAKYNFPLNPLYALGASRVGCWPCVNCGKKEIRLVAKHRPEKITLIRQWELRIKLVKKRICTFFHGKTTTPPFRSWTYTDDDGKEWPTAPIDKVVEWAHTAHGGKTPHIEQGKPTTCSSKYLACE